MAYKSVKFLAQEWREHEDPATEELIIEASFPAATNECLAQAEPIPGADPIKMESSCRPVTCRGDNQCELMTRTEPDGTIVFYCECVPNNGLAATTKSAKKSRKKAN